jgi:hypothetical protein
MLKKLNQNDRITCGACAYATLLSGIGVNINERQACDEVKLTKKSDGGTYTHNVINALKARNIEHGYAYIDRPIEEYGRWLYLNSINRFLYVTMFGQNKHKRGAPTKEHHAICVSNGMVYDSAMKDVLPLDAYVIKYNHKFIIQEFIMIDDPNPKKKLDESEVIF